MRSDSPVIDVRSEGEFSEGHIPGAVNIPLLNNEERRIVGTAYKQQGQRTAVSEGLRLVGPRLNELVSATEEITEGRPALVHCWRGGMRSSNFCKFISMAGISSQTLQGGYKAYRQMALAAFQKPLSLVLLTGLTGSGKSEILRALNAAGEQILDLEHLAAHKGSAFGGLFMPPQPTTEQFQNDLFEDILKLDPSRRIWIEDESLAIGRIFLPVDFWTTMMSSPLVEVNVPSEVRIARLTDEYGNAGKEEFLQIMSKLVKRLGGQHFNAAKEKLLEGDMSSVIAILLNYYDKAYRQSIDRRKANVVRSLDWDGTNVGVIVEALLTADKN